MEEGADEAPAADSEEISFVAAVQRWLTALTMVSASDAIATCPLRLARSQAKVLGLQVITAPFLQNRITVSMVRRDGVIDPGADWFLEQIRKAVAA